MKIFKNRLLLALFCIIISGTLIYTFTEESTSEEITAFIMTTSAEKGTKITDNMISSVTINSQNMDNVITDKTAIVGSFTATDLIADQLIIDSVITDNQEEIIEGLDRVDGDYVAISISAGSVASTVADKLLSGDIVTVHVIEDGKSYIPEELTYLEILSVTTTDGTEKTEDSEESIYVITFIVTPEQAEVLHYYEYASNIHMSLVYRGEDEVKQEFLDKQTEILENIEEEDE